LPFCAIYTPCQTGQPVKPGIEQFEGYVPKQQETEWATIGQVVALFGVRGELKVHLLTDVPDRFGRLEAVYLGPEHRRYVIEHARPYKGEMIILKLAGFDDANTAELLRRKEIQIPVSQLAELPPGSYYQHDILGLTVLTSDNRELGQIVDILETGGNDVYMIKGPDGKQILIPAIKDVVKQIDLIRRTMYIDPLPGLLELSTLEDEERELSDATEDMELGHDF
jgi:16S rRNA processing protein RimM